MAGRAKSAGWPGEIERQCFNVQPNAQPRLRGEYTMVSGRTTSSGKDAIYILDATSREMVAIRWENSRRTFVGIGYRSLDADSILPPAR